LKSKAAKRIHPVEGYNDHANMWEKLINIDKVNNCPKDDHRFTNNRHRYSVTVQDKCFKIKKNALYNLNSFKKHEKSIAKA